MNQPNTAILKNILTNHSPRLKSTKKYCCLRFLRAPFDAEKRLGTYQRGRKMWKMWSIIAVEPNLNLRISEMIIKKEMP